MFRVIKITKPDWILGENVVGIINMALDEIGSDLESYGYTWRAFCLSALHANLKFDGERVFIVAASNCCRFEGGESHSRKDEIIIERYGNNSRRIPGVDFIEWQHNQPRPFGISYGIPNRMERVGCLGNAVAPQQVYPILKAIAEIERGIK